MSMKLHDFENHNIQLFQEVVRNCCKSDDDMI